MKIQSPAFRDGSHIPKIYTCQGEDKSPPLEFLDLPLATLSLALIVDDPDVPPSVREDCMWDHWILWNLPPNTTKLEEGAVPPGQVGCNTGGENRYMGPCPPDCEHRYFFKLYALDCVLNLKRGATKKELLSAMEGHVLDHAVLMGLYEKH